MNATSRHRPASLSLSGPGFESTASLVLYAPDIDLEVVTAAVGSAPTSAHRRGHQIGDRRPAPTGVWSLEAPSALPFDEKVRFLLAATTPDVSRWQRLSQTHDIQLRCAIFLRSWTDGFVLPAALAVDIGSRHWAFSRAMYSAEGEEVIEAFLSGDPLPRATPPH